MSYQSLLGMLICSLLLLPVSVSAEQSGENETCRTQKMTKKNADGAEVRLTVAECDDEEQNFLRVDLKPPNGSEFRVFSRSRKNVPSYAVGSRLLDLDKDGYFDLFYTSSCGAGPNCETEVYRFDPSNNQFYDLFGGGFFDLEIFDHHLVESGRASANSWEYHAYPILSETPLKVSPVPKFGMTVSLEDDTDSGAKGTGKSKTTCEFWSFGKNGDPSSPKPRKPPNAAWRKFCKHYDAE